MSTGLVWGIVAICIAPQIVMVVLNFACQFRLLLRQFLIALMTRGRVVSKISRTRSLLRCGFSHSPSVGSLP